MHSATPIVLVLLVAFALYRRVRRTVGFQKFVRGRLVTRVVMFGIIGLLILSYGLVNPLAFVFDAIGAAVGIGIAYYAMQTTTFERRGNSWYYRPHPWIGVVLIVLFVGRLAFRVYQDYGLFSNVGAANQAQSQAQLAEYAHDPATAAILFVIITYYVVYYLFLIRKEQHLEIQTLDHQAH